MGFPHLSRCHAANRIRKERNSGAHLPKFPFSHFPIFPCPSQLIMNPSPTPTPTPRQVLARLRIPGVLGWLPLVKKPPPSFPSLLFPSFFFFFFTFSTRPPFVLSSILSFTAHYFQHSSSLFIQMKSTILSLLHSTPESTSQL